VDQGPALNFSWWKTTVAVNAAVNGSLLEGAERFDPRKVLCVSGLREPEMSGSVPKYRAFNYQLRHALAQTVVLIRNAGLEAVPMIRIPRLELIR
jgi:hypothetical protein